jgi:hypothetical protein
MLLAAFGAAASLLFPAPVVAVASDGPWVAVAEGRSAHDCDRVSLWNVHRVAAFRVGRATTCSPGSKVTSVSVANDRVLWLHRGGGPAPRWTLWTATAKRRTPRLLARAADASTIVIGPGNYDRRQFSNPGDGDVLPYAVGAHVVVLKGDGSVSYRWTAPGAVTALGSDVALLLVAVADGRIFLLGEHGAVEATYAGTVTATRVFWSGLGVVARRAGSIVTQGGDCDRTIPLGAGERLLAAGGGMIAIGRAARIEVVPGCKGKPYSTVKGTVASLDNFRFTHASGRRVTSRVFDF